MFFLLRCFFAGIVSFGITYYLAPLFCDIAYTYNVIDIPDGKIKQHEKPTPYLGGLAVYAGFIASLALFFPFNTDYLLLLMGATFLLFIGLIDDLKPFTPLQKLVGQSIAVISFLRAGFYLKTHFFDGPWSFFVSFLWILTIVNAFNLVDVMDGLATTIAIWITLFLCVIAFIFGHKSLVLFLVTFSGALTAFLYYNWPPAKIYLGDAGSLLIGGILAPIPFFVDWGTYNQYGYLTPIILFGIPLLEVIGLVIIRTVKKIPFYMPSSDHFCLYLKRLGLSVSSVLLYTTCVSFILYGIACRFLFYTIHPSYLFFIACLILCAWFLILFVGDTKKYLNF